MERENTTAQKRKLCLGLPSSGVDGNNLKNYINCMEYHGETPHEADINTFTSLQKYE